MSEVLLQGTGLVRRFASRRSDEIRSDRQLVTRITDHPPNFVVVRRNRGRQTQNLPQLPFPPSPSSRRSLIGAKRQTVP